MVSLQGKDISYTIIKELGEGAAGITYLAKGSDDQNYAIKEYKNTIKAKRDSEFEQKMLETILSVCKSYATCFIETIFEDDTMYLVMDYIQGVSVGDMYFGSNRTPLNDRIPFGNKLIKDLVMGLQALHSMGLVHQDIKGDNLMYTESGDVKFIDFGLSCLKSFGHKIDNIPIFGTIVKWPCGSPGTPNTSPPEMIDKYNEPDNGLYSYEYLLAHDIWSIGCVIMTWYTNPDDNDSWRPTEYAVTFQEKDYTSIFAKLKEDDELAYKIICGLFARDPEQRLYNFQKIVEYFNSWFGELQDFPNEWNKYNITKSAREKLKPFRCGAVKSSVAFKNKYSTRQRQEYGVTSGDCDF